MKTYGRCPHCDTAAMETHLHRRCRKVTGCGALSRILSKDSHPSLSAVDPSLSATEYFAFLFFTRMKAGCTRMELHPLLSAT